VIIGDSCRIGPHCIIDGRVIIGDHTTVAPGCIIGTPSRLGIIQEHQPSGRVEIGAGVILMEHVVVNAPVKERTRICDGAAIGPFGLVAHDSEIGAHSILAPHCALGGYVCLGDRANLGLGVRIHPRLVVGAIAMCGMGAVVTRHVAPGVTVQGVPARMSKINEVGLSRAGLTATDLAEWTDALVGGHQPRPEGALNAHLKIFRQQMARWQRKRGTVPDHAWLPA
jgi:UDP-N-acetylglucosamine acyltransferase